MSGIAKIDYDKRAEEILYGGNRQITEENPLTRQTIASYSLTRLTTCGDSTCEIL